MALIINASNVHFGGGLSLLCALLDSIGDGLESRFLLDERLRITKKFHAGAMVYRVRPSILGRLVGEWCLRRWTGPDDVVLCLGNLPPLFTLEGNVLLFLQNRYLVEPRTLGGFPFAQRLRITLERLWFQWGKRNVTHVVVQTPSMGLAVERYLGRPAVVLPFSADPANFARTIGARPERAEGRRPFLYVASGEPHKNHGNLIEAWILLAKEGIRPGLVLTLDKSRFAGLCRWIEERKRAFDLNIANEGSTGALEIKRLYREALALIYPSHFESLGLPLIEARCEGLPILGAEKDYVRDVIDPEETFDPDSPVSIARAVKRFLGIPEKPLQVMDAKEFLSKIYEIACA